MNKIVFFACAIIFITIAEGARYIVEVPTHVSKRLDGEFHLKATSKYFSLKHLKSYKAKKLEAFHIIETDEKIIRELLDMKLIVFAEQDSVYQIVSGHEISKEKRSENKTSSPNDPGFAMQWGLSEAGFTRQWQQMATIQHSALVFVADTWVDVMHPDFNSENMFDVVSFIPEEAQHDSPKHYHGTHVTGIISARTNNNEGISGSLWNAKIQPIEVCSSIGCPLTALVDALVYAADSHPEIQLPRIINMSLGAPSYSRILANAVDYAQNKGVTVVAAAGNSAADAINFYPASYPGVISVGALERNWAKYRWPRTNLAFFSNYGPQSLTILAPGHHILSTMPVQYMSLAPDQLEQMGLKLVLGGAYAYLSGTSMAAPMVTAAVAAMRAANPQLDPYQVLKVLQDQQPTTIIRSTNSYAAGKYKSLDASQIGKPLMQLPLPREARQNILTESITVNLEATYTRRYSGGTHLEGYAGACDSPSNKIRIRWFTFSQYIAYAPSSYSYSIRNCNEPFSVEIPLSLPEEYGLLDPTPFLMAYVDEVDTNGDVIKMNPVIFPNGYDFLDLKQIARNQ